VITSVPGAQLKGDSVAMGKVEFAILGAGAIGSIIGAHLARSGHSVVMLARGRRAEEITLRGIRIQGLAQFSQPVPVLTDVSQFSGADVLIVATKTYGTEAALAPLLHAKIGAAFSIQNGLMKNEQLAAAWGRERVLGALADTSGELLPGGETLFTRNERLYIGELGGGESARAGRIAGIIDGSGVRASAVSDIESLEWSKFASWASLMVLSVTTRAVTWKYLIDPDAALVVARLVREVGALAAARKIALSDRSPLPVATLLGATEGEAVTLVQALGQRLQASAPQHRMSTLQDLDSGRELEIEETLGYAVRSAAQLNLPLPMLECFYRLVRGIDRIRR
jgi:2-dehydropantoate 2-reductase